MPEVTVPDNNALTVKVCKRGCRIKRKRGSYFIWVRDAELLNLADLLVDAYERKKQ